MDWFGNAIAPVEPPVGSAATRGDHAPGARVPYVTLPWQVHAPLSRNARCACGSARRRKHCCARLEAVESAVAESTERQIALVCRAADLAQRGDANEAAQLLARLQPHRIEHALLAREAGEMFLDMHLLAQAQPLLARSLALCADDPQTLQAWRECRELLDRPATWRAASVAVRAQLARLEAAARGRERPTSSEIRHAHIVCKLDTIGGTERRALNLYRQLCAHVPTTLWSTQPPLAVHARGAPIRVIGAGDVPSGGTLALIGTYFDCGQWLHEQPFGRVLICHNLTQQHASLCARLAQLEANAAHPTVALTFPSRLFRDTLDLPGAVEYSPPDMVLFQRRRPHRTRSRMTVGRHGRAYALKFHPNDPAFLRAVMARGHRVKVLGGAAIAHAFAHDTGAPELLDVGAQDPVAFLDSLDVFLYRKHPQFFESCGSVILEAMAMQLPVIVFPEQCGAAELIRHGENGFLVHDEASALELIEQLAADPALRARIGAAARDTIDDLMRRQHAAVLRRYGGAMLAGGDALDAAASDASSRSTY